MYRCPFCITNALNIKLLMVHLKLVHSALSSIFICKQNNCDRSFMNMYSFKRHLMLKHPNQDTFAPELHSFDDGIRISRIWIAWLNNMLILKI